MDNEFISSKIEEFKNNYKELADKHDDYVFIVLCIYYFYYGDEDSFDISQVLECISDGPSDGGIDAVVNDNGSEANDAIIIQCKYYDSSSLTSDAIIEEFVKISDTIDNLNNHQYKSYNETCKSAYLTAINEMEKEEDGQVHIAFFTSCKSLNKKTKNSVLRKIKERIKNLGDYAIDLYFREDIEDRIECRERGNPFVIKGELSIDVPENCLYYKNAIIVNISGHSLAKLYLREREKLLGMNLRYHVAGKTVDKAIEETIKKDPDNFWYKNNGILIVCEKFELDSKVLRLHNFSIVNGGQTTFKIANVDLPKEDFYLQCKVISVDDDVNKDAFTSAVAQATNSQKPIKMKDIRANTPEQIKLKKKLLSERFYYIHKSGDKVNPKNCYPHPYNSGKLELVGKVSLAGVLQMPGTARNHSSKMYEDEAYHLIFGENANPRVIVDLIKLDYYYKSYAKRNNFASNYDDETVGMIKNGRTFALALIMLAVKLNANAFSQEDIKAKISKNDVDGMKEILRKMDGVDRIIMNDIDHEKAVFELLFEKIAYYVLGQCYRVKLRVDEVLGMVKTAPSDFLKSDQIYYREIINAFFNVYNGNKEFRECLNSIIIKK